MKLKYFIIISAALFSTLPAQSAFDVGIKIGYVNSHANSDFKGFPIELFKKSYSTHSVGLFAPVLDVGYLEMEMEISYHQEGAEDESEVTTVEMPAGTGEFVRYGHSYDLLKLGCSILPKLDFDKATVYGIGGVNLSYVAQERDLITRPSETSNLLFGYAIGAGIEFSLFTAKPMLIEFKKNFYSTKIAENDRISVSLSSYQINLGFRIL